MSASTARGTVEEVFGKAIGRELWTNKYDKVLPLTLNGFDLTAILPTMYYMFRFGFRRGKGNFLETFANVEGTAKEKRKSASIEQVGHVLAQEQAFSGFTGKVEETILGDLLLCFALENSRHATGRNEQVLRVAPAHYMASWVDLPQDVANLRYVPEMVVAILADQDGEYVDKSKPNTKTWFTVGEGYEENLLLKAFEQGMKHSKSEIALSSRTSDHFDESTVIALDQLLMVRLAQKIGSAPDKIKGSANADRISNQRPIAERAARYFSEDIRRFVREYAELVPRHAFVEMLESCMALGLTSILTSVVDILFEWEQSGEILHLDDQQPASLFVDCSSGVNLPLRGLAEQSMDDFSRRIERFPVILMALRLLDPGARNGPKTRRLAAEIPTRPYATKWLEMLGDILMERSGEGQLVLYDLDVRSAVLAEQLEEEWPEIANLLKNDEAEPSPVWRLAEALTTLQGRDNVQNNMTKLFNAAFLLSAPNGLATGRTVIRKEGQSGGRKARDVRSIILTDPVLEYLVHLHLIRPGGGATRPLSFKEFVTILRTRYGFCIDVAPPGMTISNEHLQENRRVLERRLRDLGLLVGVNDAEAMKRLKPRFALRERGANGNS